MIVSRTAVQRAQLTHLLDMMNLPTVTIEMLSGFLSLTHRDEVAAYVQAWAELDSIALHHGDARALVRRAITALDQIQAPGEAPH